MNLTMSKTEVTLTPEQWKLSKMLKNEQNQMKIKQNNEEKKKKPELTNQTQSKIMEVNKPE